MFCITEKQRNNREIERYSGVKWLYITKGPVNGICFWKNFIGI